MQSNPYVYPYTPFQDLSNKNFTSIFKEKKTISLSDVQAILQRLPVPPPHISGENIAEKILSLFLDENYLFGPASYIEQCHKDWLTKMNYFIHENKPLQFTLLGFPFKMHVPLKTNRILPDMGETLSIHRLYVLTQLIADIYVPGCVITIFTEGAFGDAVGVPGDECDHYRDYLQKLITILGYDKTLKIIDLREMEKTVPDFDDRYKKRTEYFRDLYEKKDSEYMKKFEGTASAIKRIVATTMYDEQLLMDVYNDDLRDEDASQAVVTARKDIEKRMREAIFQYHGYLQVRDDINYLSHAIPHGLSLSVSPKPERLGIIPIHKDCIRLPYHSVPVYYRSQNQFFLEYLIDIKRSGHEYTPVYFEQDGEDKPFYYEMYA